MEIAQLFLANGAIHRSKTATAKRRQTSLETGPGRRWRTLLDRHAVRAGAAENGPVMYVHGMAAVAQSLVHELR